MVEGWPWDTTDTRSLSQTHHFRLARHLGFTQESREGEEVTIVTWGQQLHECLAAAESCPASPFCVKLTRNRPPK